MARAETGSVVERGAERAETGSAVAKEEAARAKAAVAGSEAERVGKSTRCHLQRFEDRNYP